MILVNKKQLTAALDRCGKVAPQKTTSVQLSHVKIVFDDVLQYSVTNLTTSIVGSIDASGKPESFTVNVRDLLAAAQSVIGEKVKLALGKDKKLTVSGEGKRSFKVSTLDAADFPAIELTATEWVELPGQSLRECVSRILFATASDKDDRPALRSVRIRTLGGILSAAATNGYCLAVATNALESKDAFTAVVPKSALVSLLSSEEAIVGVNVTEESVSFRTGAETLIARVTTNEFPPVDSMLDTVKPEKSSSLAAPDVLESLAAIRRTDSKATIDLTFSDKELKIESGTEDGDGYAVDTLEIAGGDTGHVRISAEMLTAALKACANVKVAFGADIDPVVISDGGFTAILMPMRK